MKYGESLLVSILPNTRTRVAIAEELDFLNEVSCVPLQQGLRHLQTAFTNFFAQRGS